MINRSELKRAAKEQIKGNIGTIFLCTLILFALGTVAMIPGVGAIVYAYLITPPLSVGMVLIYLGMAKGEKASVGKFFSGFNYFGKSIGLFLLMMVCVMLWSLLFLIPGIVKSYSYSMAFYILAENPDMKVGEALNESKRMMKGHKWELFVLQLSFILWGLLTAITFGIAGIYVMPYIGMTTTNFYLALKEN